MRAAVTIFCGLVFSLAVSSAVFATTYEVLMTEGPTGDVFDPAELTIAAGDSVVWHNVDKVNHTATSGEPCLADGRWDTGIVAPGESAGLRFDDAGEFPYLCIFHCAEGMVGMITVGGPTSTDESTWGTVKSLYR